MVHADSADVWGLPASALSLPQSGVLLAHLVNQHASDPVILYLTPACYWSAPIVLASFSAKGSTVISTSVSRSPHSSFLYIYKVYRYCDRLACF